MLMEVDGNTKCLLTTAMASAEIQKSSKTEHENLKKKDILGK